MMQILQVSIKAIEKFLEDSKPDVVFFSTISNITSLLLYHIAKYRGIKTLCLYNPRLDERYGLTENYFDYQWLKAAVDDICSNPQESENVKRLKQATDYLSEYQAKPFYYLERSAAAKSFSGTSVTRGQHLNFLFPLKFARALNWSIRSFYLYFIGSNKSDYTNIKPWHEMFDKAVRKFRVLIGYNDLYQPVENSEDYAYFSLQSEPEALPMLLAPWYSSDQVWLIKQIARSLPLHYKLYVKDHPVMVGRRPRAYYTELNTIPNVKVIDPTVSGISLIAGADIVLTTSGTAGIEAAFLKKPSVVFSDVFYSTLSNVIRCHSVEDLPKLVHEALTKQKYNEKEILNFIAAIYKESVHIDLTQLWTVQGGTMTNEEKKQLIPLVDLIAEKLSIRPI
jgi:hypothetical protein